MHVCLYQVLGSFEDGFGGEHVCGGTGVFYLSDGGGVDVVEVRLLVLTVEQSHLLEEVALGNGLRPVARQPHVA